MDAFTTISPVEQIIGRDAITAMKAREGFDRAMRVASAAGVRSYDGSWLRNRLLNDRGRYLASILILDIHFNETGGAGVTTARVRRDLVACNICSAGRATAFIAGLRFGRFMEPVPARNLKEKHFGPTRLFLDAHLMRWHNLFSAIAEMDPDMAHRARTAPESGVFGPAINFMADLMRAGVRVFAMVPHLQHYADREVGFVLLLNLMALEEGTTLSTVQAAQRFSVSRTHVSALLRRATQEGLARREATGFVAGPALGPALADFFSVAFLIFERAFLAISAQR
ncbi:MAG: hypothetical protein B7Y70_07940 [Rhizobiales bacterium 35-68-8]|nr:MAG: hypothetical protein B7Y70_07940 [Rhizobiales bacterium 35-68-8]